MFELDIIATNGRYYGTTQVYDSPDSILVFAESLLGYSKGEQTLTYEAGKKDCYADFAMEFCCIDNAGHIGVQINLEENYYLQNREEEKSKLNLEIVVPVAIDRFQRELIQLAKKQDGILHFMVGIINAIVHYDGLGPHNIKLVSLPAKIGNV